MRNIFVIVLLLVAAVVGLSSGISSFENKDWKNRGRFTLLEVEDNIKVKSIDPATKLGTILELPSETLVNTLDGRGEWISSSLKELAKKYGDKWLGDSIADYLGITYTTLSNDLSWWDRLAWWNLSRSVKWTEIDLEKTNWVSEANTVDGEKVLGVNSGWQRKSGEYFYSDELAKSGFDVRVYNTTNIPGLANRIARRIESSGVRVISVEALNVKLENKCEIRSEEEYKKSTLVLWLLDNFDCVWVNDSGLDKIVDVVLGEFY